MTQSIDVITGGTATAAQYNLLRTDIIANVSSAWDASLAASLAWDATVAASAAGADVVTHAAVTAQIHGLASGIDVLGAETAGLHIQYAVGASTWSHAGGQNERHYVYVAWPTGFTNLYAVASSVGVGSVTADSAYMTAVESVRYSTVGATARVNIINAQGENTSMQLDIIGIGN